MNTVSGKTIARKTPVYGRISAQFYANGTEKNKSLN
jgi:hypothetical protein